MSTMQERIAALTGGNVVDTERQHLGGFGAAYDYNAGDSGLRLSPRLPSQQDDLKARPSLG